MQEQYLYEYAVIRVVPRVEREEFFNVGLILFSKPENYIKIRIFFPEEKAKLFCLDMDIDLLRAHLEAFEQVCAGSPEGRSIARMDIPERFRWLTSIRSASIQTSRPHPGVSSNLDATFERLFAELVL
ncbi:MAG: DUF3037 domain-containing protein [Tannerellaceae bacterium]|nr:DUF3037 domain-containing protein [Tannerellaceae bacterium]